MPGLCKNVNLERLSLACNGLTDKSSHLVVKVVNAQSERRDHIVWAYSLRGELPPSDDYKKGLKEIVLSHNNFGEILASDLVLALRNDLYMRSVDLRNNNIPESECKEFIKLFKTNKDLTNVDLRLNEGFSARLHREMALRLLKNIQRLKDKGDLE